MADEYTFGIEIEITAKTQGRDGQTHNRAYYYESSPSSGLVGYARLANVENTAGVLKNTKNDGSSQQTGHL